MDNRDTILKHLLYHGKDHDSKHLAQEVGLSEGQVIEGILQINQFHDGIIINKGYGHGRFLYRIRDTEREVLVSFLETEGGFSKQQDQVTKDKERQREKFELEIQELTSQIRYLKSQSRFNKWSLWISILAAIISIAALVLK